MKEHLCPHDNKTEERCLLQRSRPHPVSISIVLQEGYIGEIKGGLRPSMKLVIMGIINKKPKRSVCASIFHLNSLSCCTRDVKNH